MTASLAALVIAGVGSFLSLLHHQPWNVGRTVERSLPALPGIVLSFGPVNRLLVRWRVLPADRRFTPWDLAVRRAARTGSLPIGADPDEWRPHVRHRVVVLRWVAVTMVALCLAVGALTGVTDAVTSHNDAAVWALATCVAMSGLMWAGLGRTRLQETHALLDSLEARDRDTHACQVPGSG